MRSCSSVSEKQLAFVFWIERELESVAAELRRRANLRSDELALAPSIAERVLGAPVAIAPTLRTSACLARVHDSYQIFLQEIGPDSNFDIAHELAHYALREIAHYVGPDEERLANQLAAMLLAPTSVVRAICEKHGTKLRPIRPLAKAARISQTAAHLRLGEVLRDARLIVTKRSGFILTRRTGITDWEQLPILEIAGGQREVSGVLRAELRGGIDEGRVALRAR